MRSSRVVEWVEEAVVVVAGGKLVALAVYSVGDSAIVHDDYHSKPRPTHSHGRCVHGAF